MKIRENQGLNKVEIVKILMYIDPDQPDEPESDSMTKPADQLEMFPVEPAVIHYFDRNGALRSGRFVRMITRGRKKGQMVVLDAHGKQCIPFRIRNIEYRDN